jgi:nucleotide-binding universal stress UspA family protein
VGVNRCPPNSATGTVNTGNHFLLDAAARLFVAVVAAATTLLPAAQERLRGRQESWGFQRRQGMIVDRLIAVVNDIRDAHANDIVVIVVGSSSEAMHRAVGSIAVSLARHSPAPRDRALSRGL